jgi:flagellar hook-associated protein 1 FlgK
MAVIGTFGSFTAARLGIYASQASLNLTGNNIANINTKGYTRQRLDLVSLHSDGNIRYANSYNLDIGYGVLAEGTSQLRDPFMDIRYRNEQSSVGAYEARLDGLKQLSNILDEVGDGDGDFGVIEYQFNDLLQQLEILSRNANDDTCDTNVRSSAESLVQLFNDYANALVTSKDTLTDKLKEEVSSVNTILTQIRDLNEQIREAGIYGDNALELRDHRNLLIDELSTYVKVDVRYDMEKIDEFNSVERLNISIAGTGNPPIKLIQGVYGTQLTMPEMSPMRNPDFKADDPRCNRYISKASDLAAGKIVYTNSEKNALKDAGGKPVWNNAAGEATLQGMGYKGQLTQQFEEKYSPYVKLDNDGNIVGYTCDPDDATQVNNAMKKADDNRLWMGLEALTDKKGNLMKEEGGTVSEAVDLSDTVLFGALQSYRELITEEGEFASEQDITFDPDANIKRGIPYYQHALDALARKFAETMNEANKPMFAGYETERDANGVEVYKTNTANCDLVTGNGDAAAVLAKLTAAGYDKSYLLRKDLSSLPEDLRAEVKIVQEKHLSPTGNGHGIEKMAGGNLFSTSGDGDDGTGITAANISIAKKWSTGEVRIRCFKENNDGLDHSTDSSNVSHMITLMGEKMEYKPRDVVGDAANNTKYYSGTFQEMLNNTNHVLASDQKTTTTLYNGYTTRALALDNDRQSVSGVDLNEEATSMMMYQKSYAAACQLMTTLDSMLDKLINGTIR